MNAKKIIYIFGAGRSGSTVLATVLNDHPEVQHVGELHHFFRYLTNNEPCSCGSTMRSCEFWRTVYERLPSPLKEHSKQYEQLAHKMEYHTAIPSYLTGQKEGEEFEKYKQAQEELVEALHTGKQQYILDSAKYIGRFLALRQIFNRKIKGIYLVRDIRGVIWSFQKRVQTQSSPPRTLLYYLGINVLGQLLCLFMPDDQVTKVRYEDIVEQPENTFRGLGNFLKIDLSESIDKIKDNNSFSIPHIIGGNRLKKSGEIVLRKDVGWIENMSVSSKICYYLLALPLMIINRYKVFK